MKAFITLDSILTERSLHVMHVYHNISIYKCLLFSLVYSQNVTSHPSIFFENGHKTLVEGSVVWLYCSISADFSTFWTKDSEEIVQNAPHIRMRKFNDRNTVTSVLVIDKVIEADGGKYQCQAKQGSKLETGPSTNLTG